jgi:2-amino-4-hydroxy-6-hydroxymethyldihydropteridine diphosphokinase
VSNRVFRNRILVAFGSNLASETATSAELLREAQAQLERSGATIRAASRLYHSPAFPPGNGPDYVNAAANLEANWTAVEALRHLHAIEAMMGRKRGERWGRRTLDLDLLAVGDTVLPDAATHRRWREMPLSEQVGKTPGELILPHPRMQDRAFVLVPLAEVALDWVHPLTGLTVRQMLDRLSEDDIDGVTALE